MTPQLNSKPSKLLFAIAACIVTSLFGCSEKLMRENVFASTQTGIGIFLMQNQKTQAYEAKLGYLRNELFFVPTSKTILYEQQEVGFSHGLIPWLFGATDERTVADSHAGVTANVLAEIAAGGKTGTSEQGFDVRQRLAVGDIAVQSKGAIFLMAKDDAAASAALGHAIPQQKRVVVARMLAQVYQNLRSLTRGTPTDMTAVTHVAQLDAIAPSLSNRPNVTGYRWVPASNQLNETVVPFGRASRPFERVISIHAEMSKSMQHVRNLPDNFKFKPNGGSANTASAGNKLDIEIYKADFTKLDKDLTTNDTVRAAVKYYQSLLTK